MVRELISPDYEELNYGSARNNVIFRQWKSIHNGKNANESRDSSKGLE